MATMRAVDIKDGSGPVENLFINDQVPRPRPTGSQALVKVRCFGLNRADTLQRKGGYPVPAGVTHIMGLEFSGTIEELASESESGFNKGDAVFGLAYGGAYAEYLVVSTHMLIHKPAELSFEQCAAIPEVWMTALQAMYLVGQYKAGQSVLWHAGASSVSIAGQQLCHYDGASRVFATTRQDEKCKFLVEHLHATAAYNTETTKWDEAVLKDTEGKGVDLIIDYIGAPSFAQNLNAAARDGHIVTLGSLGGTNLPAETNIAPLLMKRLRYEGSTLRSRDEQYQGKLRDLLVDHALEKFKDGSFKIIIEKVFPWTDIQQAHALIESNATKGKVLCTIS